MAPRNRALSFGADTMDPEDLGNPLVADHLDGRLPPGLVEENGHPVAASSEQEKKAPVLSPEQMVKLLTARIEEGFLKAQAKLPAAIGEVVDLAFLQAGLDRGAVRVSLPFNTQQVIAGGYAMLRACRRVKAASVMNVDEAALGKDLALCERIERLRVVVDTAYAILHANETVALSQVATRVDKGLRQGWSTVENNGELTVMLEAALAIRGGPAADAQQKRAENERRDQLVRNDEQSRQRELAVEAPSPAITLTTVTPPVAGAPKAQTEGKPPTAPGTPRK